MAADVDLDAYLLYTRLQTLLALMRDFEAREGHRLEVTLAADGSGSLWSPACEKAGPNDCWEQFAEFKDLDELAERLRGGALPGDRQCR